MNLCKYCAVASVTKDGNLIKRKVRYNSRLRDLRRHILSDVADLRLDYPTCFILLEYREYNESKGKYLLMDTEEGRIRAYTPIESKGDTVNG